MGKAGFCRSANSKKHTPRVAEMKLVHLEGIVRGVLRSNIQGMPTGPQYWRARFRQLENGHVLFPVQQTRVEALRKMITDIEAVVVQDGAHADRRVAA
jgi:hypothetical protein